MVRVFSLCTVQRQSQQRGRAAMACDIAYAGESVACRPCAGVSGEACGRQTVVTECGYIVWVDDNGLLTGTMAVWGGTAAGSRKEASSNPILLVYGMFLTATTYTGTISLD